MTNDMEIVHNLYFSLIKKILGKVTNIFKMRFVLFYLLAVGVLPKVVVGPYTRLKFLIRLMPKRLLIFLRKKHKIILLVKISVLEKLFHAIDVLLSLVKL